MDIYKYLLSKKKSGEIGEILRRESMIGSVWQLKVDCLGNKAGTIGYCFNDYPDFDNASLTGVQIIFPNGEYDGFSAEEQENFLEFVSFDLEYTDYNFTNVINVSRDFDKGYWKWSKQNG